MKHARKLFEWAKRRRDQLEKEMRKAETPSRGTGKGETPLRKICKRETLSCGDRKTEIPSQAIYVEMPLQEIRIGQNIFP